MLDEHRQGGLDALQRGCLLAQGLDFVARRAGQEPLLVQVCADLRAEGTRERELRALREALQEHEAAQALLVSMDIEDTVDVEEARIRIVPAWRWLLEPEVAEG